MTASVLHISACARDTSQARADSVARAKPIDSTVRARDAVAATPPAPATPVATIPAGGPDQSELFVLLRPARKSDASAELLVTDPRGRRMGVEPGTFKTLNEILNASYDSAPPPTQTDTDPEPGALTKQFDLVTPAAGEYSVSVVGRRAGEVMLVIRVVTPQGDTRESAATRIATSAGGVQRYAFTYDPAQRGPIAVRQR